jgi:hypothetical protein
MPLLNSQNENARSGRQLGIGAMALLQLLVLFAIGHGCSLPGMVIRRCSGRIHERDKASV